MTEDYDLTAIIVGQTPISQFLSWRLCLKNTNVILISKLINSSVKSIAWESDKLGTSSYTPNTSLKCCNDIKGIPKLKSKKIDVLILDPLSIEDLKQDCKILQNYIDNETLVFLSSNFGCELEPLVIKYLNEKGKCVASILCDFEIRQISQNKFHIDSGNTLKIHLGISYQSNNFQDEMYILMSQNESSIKKQFSQVNSTSNQIVSKLLEDWLFVKKYNPNTSEFSLLTWEVIIPKISLNILSIAYELRNYNKLLENKSILKVYKNVVLELMNICCMQCGSHVPSFLYSDNKRKVNFNKILEAGFNGEGSSEHTFEYYCFTKGYPFPIDILLNRPIQLAEKYDMKSSNIKSIQDSYRNLQGKTVQAAIEPLKEDIDTVPVLSSELEKLYIDVESLPTTTTIDEENEIKSVKTQSPSEIVLNGMCATNVMPVNCLQYLKDSLWTTDFETQGVIGIPHYPSSKTHNPIKRNTYAMNESIKSLEKQIRTKRHLFANDYDRINAQMIMNGGRPYTEHSKNAQKLKYGWRDTQLWKLQRKLNIERGLLGASPTRPYEDLLNHIRILNRANTGDVLPFTTARFGKVDTFHLLNENKEHIMALFEHVSQREKTTSTE